MNNDLKELLDENDKLRIQLMEALELNNAYLKTLKTLSPNLVRKELRNQGIGLRRRKDVSQYDILKLYNSGLSKSQIAEQLGTSISLVYRRLAKLEDAGVI